MTGRIHRENKALSDLVKDAIVEMITTESFSSNKLPSESKLSERFGVSVAVVREALLLLSKDGVVTKKQGSGNYFHLSALNSGTRIGQYPGFRHMLRKEGYEVTERCFNIRRGLPDEKARRFLKLAEGERVVSYERLLFADGHPAILCHNRIPEKLFRRPMRDEDMEVSLFDIFRDYLGMEMTYGMMQFYPHLASREDAEKLEVEEGRALILMEEEYYSLADIPMGYSQNLFNDKYFTVNILSR